MAVCNLPTILIVDDDNDFAEEVSETLQLQGWETLPTNSATAALEHLKSNRTNVGVVISDLHMPSFSGVRLARELQARLGKDCPEFILISGQRDIDTVLTALRLQVADFLAKPVSTSELLSSVEQAVERLHKRVSPERGDRKDVAGSENFSQHHYDFDPLKLFVDVNQIAADQLQSDELDHQQIRMLIDIAWHHRANKTVTVTGLAYGLNVPAATTHRKLKDLQTRGLVELGPDPNDKRLTCITLSQSGSDAVDRLAAKISKKLANHD